MMHRTQVPARPVGSLSGRLALRASVAMIGLLVLSGCARQAANSGFGSIAPAAQPASTDPAVIWASRAQPGAVEQVALADGRTAQLRLVRAYNAASGRECRELLVGAGMAERSRLVCATPGGGWVEARPLLRGGGSGAARP